MLWHQRLGHIREKGLRLLHGKGMVEGMSYCSLDFYLCEHFVYGKQESYKISLWCNEGRRNFTTSSQ
jgi:hypothetical protein